VHAQNGASLCPQCAAQFYCTCAGCGGLIPQDEAVVRDGALCRVQCLTAPVSNDDAATLSDEALAALVAEFIRLHAEAKQLNERLDMIKEQLKRYGGVMSQAQADRPRFTGPLHPDTSRPRRLRAGRHLETPTSWLRIPAPLDGRVWGL
jgi:hypothetical protein